MKILQKKICILLLLIFSAYFSFAQTPKLDSLLNVLKNAKEDSNKVNLLGFISGVANGQGYYEKALSYGKEAILLAKKLHYKKGETDVYNTIGMTWWNLGDYLKALENINKASDIANAISYKGGKAASLMYSGIIYSNQKMPDEALKAYNEALPLWKELGNKVGASTTLANMGNIQLGQGKKEDGIKNCYAAFRLREEVGEKVYIAESYDQIGSIHEMKKEYAEALNYYNKAFKIWNETGSREGQAGSYLNFARLKMKEGKMNEAIENVFSSLEVSKTAKQKRHIAGAYAMLTEIYTAQKKYKEAFENHQLLVIYNDSLLNESNDRQISISRTRFETEKKEKENEQLKLEKAKVEEQKQEEENKRYMSIGIGTILLLTMSIGGYAFYQNRQTKNKLLLQKSEIEKNLVENNFLRSRMDPHFVSNALLSVNDFVGQKKNKLAQEYLERFNELMRWILENSSRDLVTLTEELEMLNNYLILEKPRMENGLEWVITVAEDIDATDIELPPLILQTFVENAIKHGISGLEREGKINIAVSKVGNKINCTIEDNGRGIKEEIKASSKGLKLTRERLELFSKLSGADATLDIITLEQGTRVTLIFTA